MYDIITTSKGKHRTLVRLDPALHHLVLTVSTGTEKLQWAPMGFNGLEGVSERHTNVGASRGP